MSNINVNRKVHFNKKRIQQTCLRKYFLVLIPATTYNSLLWKTVISNLQIKKMKLQHILKNHFF